MAGDVLEVGDVMRWSAALMADVKERLQDGDILVRVTRIDREDDGTVRLWLTNADDIAPCAGQVN